MHVQKAECNACHHEVEVINNEYVAHAHLTGQSGTAFASLVEDQHREAYHNEHTCPYDSRQECWFHNECTCSGCQVPEDVLVQDAPAQDDKQDKMVRCEVCAHDLKISEAVRIPGIGYMHPTNTKSAVSECMKNLREDGFENALQRAAATARQFGWMKPRNPDRIDEVLKEIERIWRKHPDLRLTQLIANVLPGESPHYNVEDSDLLDNLRRVYP